jgi:hypothetical protein
MHRKKTFTCPYCGESFYLEIELSVHELAKHPNKKIGEKKNAD